MKPSSRPFPRRERKCVAKTVSVEGFHCQFEQGGENQVSDEVSDLRSNKSIVELEFTTITIRIQP